MTLSVAGHAIKRRWRRLAPLSLVVSLAGMIVGGCSSEGSNLKFTAAVGEDCRDCSRCSSIVNSCVCDTCTDYAVDATQRQLLVCTGIWEVYKKCPGGVSVSCSDNGYNLACLDENGNKH